MVGKRERGIKKWLAEKDKIQKTFLITLKL